MNVVFKFRVSIHAPVWVRLRQTSGPHPRHGFQFTHPCGCDTLTWSLYENGAGFNSRTRVGATSANVRAASAPWVSIHAPVWVRHADMEPLRKRCRFQFTHPCGCDVRFVFLPYFYQCFNSRTRVGATLWFVNQYISTTVSIHAPVWVRRQIRILTVFLSMFQFTHPCGCDAMVRESIH